MNYLQLAMKKYCEKVVSILVTRNYITYKLELQYTFLLYYSNFYEIYLIINVIKQVYVCKYT